MRRAFRLVPGTESTPRAGCRAPGAEPNAHGGYARSKMQDGGDGTALGGGGSEWHGVCWRLSDVPPVEAAGARIGTVGTAGGRTPWDPRGGGREACICRWWFRVCGGGGGGGPAGEGGTTPRSGKPPKDTLGLRPSAWVIGNAKQRRSRLLHGRRHSGYPSSSSSLRNFLGRHEV